MSGNRLFSLKPEIKISAEEAVLLVAAYEKITGKKAEIGHIVQEIAQEQVDAAIARFIMMGDRRG